MESLLPALVEFHNRADKSVTVTTTDGQVLEDGCDLVLPGGVVNYLAIDVTGRLKHPLPLSLRLVPGRAAAGWRPARQAGCTYKYFCSVWTMLFW